MAVFNTFTFDGENSLDYGVYITGEAVYNAPERAVEMVSIPGKNGALALDQGRFENIEVTYPAGTFGVEQAEFAGRMRAMRNMLASRYNYVRLTDSYHPDEYRLGLYKSGLEASPVAMSSAGEFDITFNCKPQRFLTSGEESVDTSELGGDVTTDKVPYLFRRSGGGNIGHDFDAEIDKIIGGTVAWNQLVQNGNFASTSNWSADGTFTVANNKATFSASSQYGNLGQNLSTSQKNHRYLFIGTAKSYSDSDTKFIVRDFTSISPVSYTDIINTTLTTIRQTFSKIVTSSNGCVRLRVQVQDNKASGRGNIEVENVMLIDLTQAFGTEIADYVYSLEQTTSGSGIAWLKSHGFLTKDYYAYNSGSLQSVKTSKHRTSGKNLVKYPYYGSSGTVSGITITVNNDGTISLNGTATARIVFGVNNSADGYDLSNGQYIATCEGVVNGVGLMVEGYNGNAWVKQLTQVIPSVPSPTFVVDHDGYNLLNSYLFINNGTALNNVVIKPMIRFASVSDATYEPYNAHTYPLDSDLELRGKFKLDANNNLYAEGDVYESSGNVSRKYGIVDLGTLSWSVNGSGFTARLGGIARVSDISICNFICQKYAFNGAGKSDMPDKSIRHNATDDDYLYVKDSSYSSGSDLATALSGQYLVYELATPTTEQADPYASPQVVNPLGTEEYVDTRDVPVPVGHETKYGMSQLVLSNPTEFPSKPLLEVTGVGTFWLGDTLFTITGTAGQTIYIDCETGEAWKNTGGIITPANGLVTLNRLDFPELDPGDTPVMYGTGITKVVVTPRWWII